MSSKITTPAPTNTMQNLSHLGYFKHPDFVVHMVLERDGPYLKPSNAEGGSRRFRVVVFALALQIMEVANG